MPEVWIPGSRLKCLLLTLCDISCRNSQAGIFQNLHPSHYDAASKAWERSWGDDRADEVIE
jgi:hypothetical protein